MIKIDLDRTASPNRTRPVQFCRDLLEGLQRRNSLFCSSLNLLGILFVACVLVHKVGLRRGGLELLVL